MSVTQKLIDALCAEDLRQTLPTNTSGEKFRKRDISEITGICYHQELGWGSLEAVHKYHTGTNHMSAKGLERAAYTWGIRRNGSIALLNDPETVTWSQKPNTPYMSVMFEGCFRWDDNISEYLGTPVGEPSMEQIQALLQSWTVFADVMDLGIKDIKGHFDFGKPACPGSSIEAIIRAVRDQFVFDTTLKDANGHKDHFLDLYKFKSVKEFQEKLGVTADGLWGNGTNQAAYKWLTKN